MPKIERVGVNYLIQIIMKRQLVLIGIVFAAIACSKEEPSLEESHIKKTTDPVIEYYSQFGVVERMGEEYIGQSNQKCSNYSAIYQLIPKHGSFAGQICEIYRFTRYEDISGPCDDSYNLAKKEEQFGNIKYIHCPDEGNNCKTLDMPWGCSLVFCDENEVK